MTGDEVYTFMIKATDPSGAPGSQETVTVNLKDVNEERRRLLAPSKDQKTLYIDENADQPADPMYTHKTDRADKLTRAECPRMRRTATRLAAIEGRY